ncbi:MAG TPA: uridine kinase [Galbitalea sp.]|jgi:uridine kinase
MATWTPEKRDVLSALAEEFLHNYGEGRTIIAVDGPDGAGKTRFADNLADELRVGPRAVFRASVDDFHNPRAVRYARGRDSAEGFYRDSFDYRTFKRVLIEPFRIGRIGSFVPAAFDVRSDQPVEPKWLSGPDDAILIVDGIFLNRSELRGLWNYSIWLDVDPGIAAERLLERDGKVDFPERYTDGFQLYVEDANPRDAASAIINNDDFEHPKRVFADAC